MPIIESELYERVSILSTHGQALRNLLFIQLRLLAVV